MNHKFIKNVIMKKIVSFIVFMLVTVSGFATTSRLSTPTPPAFSAPPTNFRRV